MSWFTERFWLWSELLIAAAGSGGIFLAFFTAQVIPPIPTALLALAAGFFALAGETASSFLKSWFILVSLPAALGVTVGSLFIYYPAYFLGKPFVSRFGRYLRFSWGKWKKSRRVLRKAPGTKSPCSPCGPFRFFLPSPSPWPPV